MENNLLENALRYSPHGAPIAIRAEASESEMAVEILDRGPGIPPGEADLVFEKFYRGKGRPEPGGIGLGLAICQAIVRAHGGTIRVLPRQGGGAIFRFTLPRASEVPAPPPAVVKSQ